MNAAAKFAVGAGAVIALGVAAIHLNIAPGSRDAAAQKLARAGEARDAGMKADWLNHETRGQRLVLWGEAPTPEDLEAARGAIPRANLLTGPLTVIDQSGLSSVDLPPLADPHLFVAERQNGALSLSGQAPSRQARDAIYQLAAMRFQEADISGVIEIARSTVNEDAWMSGASLSLQALARLENGAVEIENKTLRITGAAVDDTRADIVRELLRAAPAIFETDISLLARPAAEQLSRQSPTAPALKVASAPADGNGAIPDEATGQATGPETDAEEPVAEEPAATTALETAAGAADEPREQACLNALKAAIDQAAIGFSTNESDLDARSRRSLRAIASAASDCADISMTIVGHTDSRGASARNRELSLYRADAVAAFLRTIGVGETQIATRGAGESAPVASNRNEQGRAANRRIEFIIEDEAR